MPVTSLVLSGGNALGAYHGGAWQALEGADIVPDWIAGASIGAIMCGIIAGNPPAGRLAAMRRYWDAAASPNLLPGVLADWLPDLARKPFQLGNALVTRIFGQSSLFRLRLPVSLLDRQPGLYDVAPMRALLNELIDFDRLNDGAMRVSVVAVDLATGQERVFDTRRERIGLDHLLASAALIPDFPAVEIDGRLWVDGGFSSNLPVHVVLDPERPADGPHTCFCVDLLPAAAPLPVGLLQAAQRQSDLIFACQSERTLTNLRARWLDRAPGAAIYRAVAEALESEIAMKGFEFSAGSLADRWARGQRDMGRAIQAFEHRRTDMPASGLTVYNPG